MKPNSSITHEVRREAYRKAKDRFNQQEKLVLEQLALYKRESSIVNSEEEQSEVQGLTAWEIHDKLDNVLITSVRRCLTDLSTDDERFPGVKPVEVVGKKKGQFKVPNAAYAITEKGRALLRGEEYHPPVPKFQWKENEPQGSLW